MAWYDGTHACGHEGRVNVVGPTRDREWKVDNHFEKLCLECWEIEKQRKFDEENLKAAEAAAEMELPVLTGSEKQVSWANTLRQKWIEIAEGYVDNAKKNIERLKEADPAKAAEIEKTLDNVIMAIDHILRTKTQARKWIDGRGDNVSSEIIEVAEELEKAKAIPVVPEAVKQEALEDMTIRPSEPTISLVTEIRIKEAVVTAKLPQKDDGFNKIVKQLKYKWTGTVWQREMSIRTGSPLDRAAELGIRLLAAGYPVRVYREDLQDQILAGSFEAESTRWVMKNTSDTGKISLVVKWNREDGDFYAAAKRLPGAKWKSGSGMLVPKEAFREVRGFAEAYGFSISPGARDLMEDARQIFEAAMVADITAPKKEVLPQPGQRPRKLEVEQGGIDKSLKEDDRDGIYIN